MKLLLLVSFLSLWRRSDGTGAAPINMLVKEGDDVILPCSFSSRNIRQDLFDWNKDMKEVFMYDKAKVYNEGDSRQDEQFRGRVFHFPEHLDVGNASIVIRATKWTDRGNYTCLFPLLVPERRSNIELVVGAAPKPSVSILDGTTVWALLQCEVHGAFPKPDVQWQNRAGDIVPAEEPQVTERGGRYDIILQTTVTKTDHYRCVSTQEEIHHQIYDETFVLLNDAGGTLPVWVAVAVAGFVVGFAVGVVVGAVVVLLKKKTHSAVQSKSDQSAVDSSGNSGLDQFRPDSSVVTIRRRPLIQDTDSMTSGSDSS